MALGVEPAEVDAMSKPPRPASASVFSEGLGADVIWQGIVIAGLALASYFIGVSEEERQTMAFLTLAMCEVFHSMNMRSRTRSVVTLGNQNKLLWGAMGLSTLLTLMVIYIPGLNGAFQLDALTPLHFLAAFGLGFAIIPIVELRKLFTKKK
jgi:Ca2+-transporting ATPase